MALNPCVKQILCGLSGTVLRSLNGLITAQIGILQAQIIGLEAQLLQYDILSFPLEQSANLIRGFLAQVRNSALLIPLQLIEDCADLGDFNVNIQRSIDLAISELDNLLGNLTRLLSFREELAATIAELNGIIDQFQDVLTTIETCGPFAPEFVG